MTTDIHALLLQAAQTLRNVSGQARILVSFHHEPHDPEPPRPGVRVKVKDYANSFEGWHESMRGWADGMESYRDEQSTQ